MTWELLARPGEAPQNFSLSGEEAIRLLNDATTTANSVGLLWETDPIVLQPQPKLVELVRLSQLEATKESGEGGN